MQDTNIMPVAKWLKKGFLKTPTLNSLAENAPPAPSQTKSNKRKKKDLMDFDGYEEEE